MPNLKKNEDNSIKIGEKTTFRGDVAIGRGAKIINNSSKIGTSQDTNWTKLQVVLLVISTIIIILAFLGFSTVHDFFQPTILLTVDNQSSIGCVHKVPELNSSWKLIKEKLPEGFNISNYADYTIDPVLYYPWGFIITITREKEIDIIEPILVISYNEPNLFSNAYLSSGLVAPEQNLVPKIYTGKAEPKNYKTVGSLYYHLDSPFKTSVSLPDLTKDNTKVTVAVTFLIDLNHDCNKDFPISFKVVEKTHGIETAEKLSLLKVVDL